MLPLTSLPFSAINIGVHVSFKIRVFTIYISRSESMDHKVVQEPVTLGEGFRRKWLS